MPREHWLMRAVRIDDHVAVDQGGAEDAGAAADGPAARRRLRRRHVDAPSARRPRLAAAGVLGLLVLSMPVVAEFLIRFVDTSVPLDLEAARTAQGGRDSRRRDPARRARSTAATRSRRSRSNACVTARASRASPAFRCSSRAESVLGGEPEAKLMAASLEHEFGVPVRWIEAALAHDARERRAVGRRC